MAPKYKVTYFDIMALAEPIRYLLSYGGIEFEDVRVKGDDWPKLKNGTPFGKMPVLEVDGKKAHQSIAIARYLGKQVGLAGADDWQNLKIDATVDTVVDLRIAVVNAVFADEATKAQKKETLEKDTLPFYLGRLDNQIKENGGYLVDKKLTWADLHLAATVDSVNGALKTNIAANYSNVGSLTEKVWNLPKIKEWRAKRPSASM
ncbi:hypothetical protein R5R35_003180 [Gryllus longicercus]|uniref:glutathione transferase n=1 Tax=Gryllus longicercus TaxID=2509291 RepID=A0AAN9VGP5_9ORTH